ncbi:MAG TPA: peptidase S41, partial [Thermoanaerobaculia bacterium]|nr:peptidase S41 [Thermoanaerobaculia bacterium]
VSAEGDIENGGLSPKAERALFAARGDIFTAPIEKGPVRNLTHSSNAHDRLPSWSPDGSKIAFVSDRTGEEEIYLINQDGSGTPEALTTTFKARLYRLAWAPDGKRIAFADKNGKVYVLTVADKKVVEVADDPRGLINDYTWSPKGNFLAFTLSDARGYGSIQIWSAADGQRRQASQGFFNEFNPAWDPEGKYLYFLSQRSFVPLVDQVEWNYANDRQVQIYALALQKDGPNPFPPQSDEVTVETAKPSADASADKAADKGKEGGKKADAKKGDEKGETKTAEAELKVDFDGLQNRVTLVPVPAENYFGLSAVKGHLIYAKFSGFYYGREGVGQPSVEVFSFEKRQAKTLASGVQNGEL